MKLVLALSLLFFTFTSNAETTSVTHADNNAIEAAYPGGPGKGSRKTKRVNKRRKKKCKQFGRRIYAG